jgi:hypothetical protein
VNAGRQTTIWQKTNIHQIKIVVVNAFFPGSSKVAIEMFNNNTNNYSTSQLFCCGCGVSSLCVMNQ